MVLGGDVWLSSNGDLAISGDSWHFEPNREVPHHTNVVDGAAKARGYIAAYPDSSAGIPYFEIVVQRPSTPSHGRGPGEAVWARQLMTRTC